MAGEMTTGFTAGPWRFGRHGSIIADGTDHGRYLVAENVTAPNRRLILEAPEMFAVLRDMRRLGLFRGVYGAERVRVIAEAERILDTIEQGSSR